MAVLNSIRKRSFFLIVIIALALFSFIIADAIRSSGSVQGGTNVGRIAGKDVDRVAFGRKVEQLTPAYGSQTAAANAAWEQELRSIVLENEYEKLGLDASPAAITQMLRLQLSGNPTFSDENGQYSPTKTAQYVKGLDSGTRQVWNEYLAGLADSAKEQQYLELVKAGVGATEVEGRINYQMENDKRSINYVRIPFTSIPDDEVSVSEAEIRDYIAARPNDYKVQAEVDLDYVLFESKPSDEDILALDKTVADMARDRNEYNAITEQDEDIQGLATTDRLEDYVTANSDLPYNERYQFKSKMDAAIADKLFATPKGEVYGPYKEGNYTKISKIVDVARVADSVKSSHILLDYAGANRATSDRTKEETRAMIDSIFPLVKNNKTKFAEVANEINSDGTKGKDGLVGWTQYSTFNPQSFDPAYAEFIFDNEEGDIGIVESAFGIHIIRIDEKTGFEDAVQLATIAKKQEASEETNNRLFSQAVDFQQAVDNGGSMSELAEAAGTSVRPVKNIKAMDENIPGVGKNREIVRWAFGEDADLGDVKRFDLSNGNYVVARVTGKRKAGLLDATTAAVTVTPLVRNMKKAELIKAKIGDSRDLAAIASANGETQKSAASLTRSNPTVAGAGNEPMVVGAAFGLEKDQVSKPIVGKSGVFVIKTTGIADAPKLDNYRANARRMNTASATQATTKLVDALKAAADVQDDRGTVY